MKESLLIKDQMVANQHKLKKIKYKSKAILKHQAELEQKRDELSEEVRDLEERIAAGRRGENLEVDLTFPDLVGDDEAGIDVFLSSSSAEKMLIDAFDPDLFDDLPSEDLTELLWATFSLPAKSNENLM